MKKSFNKKWLILALNSEDYELFMNLVNARATMLILDDRCEDALAAFDNTNMDGLPDEIKCRFIRLLL